MRFLILNYTLQYPNAGSPPQPRSEKLMYIKWLYIPWYIFEEKNQKSQKDLFKKRRKRQFPIKVFQNSKDFLNNFQEFYYISSKQEKVSLSFLILAT